MKTVSFCKKSEMERTQKLFRQLACACRRGKNTRKAAARPFRKVFSPPQMRGNGVYGVLPEQAVSEKARTPEQLWVTERLAGQWEKFCLIKEKLQGVLLPADEKSTRIEQIADVVCRCTQCADKEFADFSAFDFEENEDKYLPFAMSLAEINFFCAAAENIFENRLFAAEKLAKTFVSKPLKAPFVQGQLRHCGYCNGTLTANVDSLGNSAVKFGVVMHTSVGTEIYCGGRNVFDTFCKSRFGEKTADFLSETPDLAVRMQYFCKTTARCDVTR